MMIAKQGIVITHAIALTALLIVAMGWQAQVQKKPAQTGFMSPEELSPLSLLTLPSETFSVDLESV
jgi:hypothetical protein